MAEQQNTFVEAQLKNIDVLLEANRIYFNGYQAVVNRQGEIAKESLNAIAGAVEEGLLKDIPTRVRDVFDYSVENVREIVKMNVDVNRDALGVIRTRVEEVVEDMRNNAEEAVEAVTEETTKAVDTAKEEVAKAVETAKEEVAKTAKATTRRRTTAAKKEDKE
ncbi:MAG: hypothetical protein AAF512_10780 [Pseudomonadota bacterium]